jgi:hypothetical protein
MGLGSLGGAGGVEGRADYGQEGLDGELRGGLVHGEPLIARHHTRSVRA